MTATTMGPERFDPVGDLGHRLAVLEASAGTGKTYSITTLFLRLILEPEWTCEPGSDEPVEAKKILVVTFTEAATAQMRERIRGRLRAAQDALERAAAGWDPDDGGDESARWCGEQDSDGVLRHVIRKARASGAGGPGRGLDRYVDRVRLALDGFDEITISTIHGFCQRMLLRNAFESGTDFDCELVADLGTLVDDVVLDYWVRRTWNLDRDLLVAARDFTSLSHLRDLATQVALDPDLVVLPPAGKPFDGAAWEGWRGLLRRLAREWERDRDTLLPVLEREGASKRLSNTWYSKTRLDGSAARMTAWLDRALSDGVDPWDDRNDFLKVFARSHLAGPAVSADARKKGWTLPPLPGLVDTVDEVRAALAPQGDNLHRFLMDLRHGLLREAREVIPRRKLEQHVQGFDDLLRNLRQALVTGGGEALRKAIAAQYRVAIIDEFQDTDPVQWDIFRTVFGPGTGQRLILIGDPKQAIYAFRKADIETYLDACGVVDGNGGVRRGLDTNWRSDGYLVEAMNHLYGRDRLPDAFLRAGIEYQRVAFPEKHRARAWANTRELADWQAPLRLVMLGRKPNLARPPSKETCQAMAVRFTAADIHRFLTVENGLRVDRGGPGTPGRRPVLPGDVAVVVRTHEQGRQIARALRRLGIPCVRRGQETVLSSEEALELRWLLDGILAPRDRGAMRTALATGIVGLSASQLAALETRDEDIEAWRKTLEEWARAWQDRGFMRMFRAVLDRQQVVERYLSLPDGERRVTNLLHLAELIHDAGKRQALRPDAQRAWFGRQIEHPTAADDPDALLLRLESDADAVKVVTTHGCKGLEYPFVWVPFLWEGRPKPGKGLLRFHVPDPRDPGRRLSAVDLAPEGPDRKASEGLQDQETICETLRLAYVALTRAQHTCTVVTVGASALERSPGAMILHQDPATGEASPEERAARLAGRVAGIADETLSADLQRIAAGAPGRILALESPWNPSLPRERYVAPEAEGPDLAPEAPLTRTLDGRWKRGSFSGMVLGARPGDGGEELEPETRDHDALPVDEPVCRAGSSDPAADPAADPAVDPVPAISPPDTPVELDLYPRGCKAGEFMHEVFERLDFHGADEARIADRVARSRLAFHLDEPHRAWSDGRVVPVSFARAVRKVLDTPLGLPGTPEHALTLGALERRDTLRELTFDLPARGGFDARPGRDRGNVTRSALVRAFQAGAGDDPVARAYAKAADRLTFDDFHGYLTGAIDLVFRWRPEGSLADARWYVVDYKSNRLAPSPRTASRWSDYAPDRLLDEMVHAHYVLQYHLYLVALHRYLRQRLPGYDYDRHVGGVFYLFLRGLQGGAGQGDGGVFRDRPPVARIEALSALFDDTGAGTEAGG